MKKILSALVVILVAVILVIAYARQSDTPVVAPGDQPGTSTPVTPNPQPTPSGQVTAENIQVAYPTINATVTSPLAITGQARLWYFEASFPVMLYDANGKIIAQGPAQAQGEWMTTEFVPFKATLTFAKPTTKTGTLILKNDNPSGLPENDESISIPVVFE